MELEKLRIFVAAAESGSLSGAGRQLYISHSTVSRAVAALERELGVPLMERDSHDTKLTAAGETLLEEARKLLQCADEAVSRVKNII